MKKVSDNLFTQISNTEFKQLTVVIKETLALKTDGNQKIFSAADLWNIQRNKKSVNTRRVSF